MKTFNIFLFVLLLHFEIGSASVPNYLLHKLDTSLSSLEAKANEIKNSLDQQERNNRAEFLEIKELLKLLNRKIGVVENVTSTASSSSQSEASSDQFWDTTAKFCNQSKHNILQQVSTRNIKHYQYTSLNEDLNECVYMDGLCGGILVGKKGVISYRGESNKLLQMANHSNNRTRCIWTVRTNDHRTRFRLFLRNGNLNGFKLSVTSMQSLLGAGDNNFAANNATLMKFEESFINVLPIWPNNNSSSLSSMEFMTHSKHVNDVFFITLAYNQSSSMPDFFLQFEGNGISKPQIKYFHYHKTGEKGLFSSKIDFLRDVQRAHHEFATFVINPNDMKKSLSTFQLNLTRIHTQNSQAHEFFTFFESSESSSQYNVAGGSRSTNNKYHGSNRTFSSEFVGDDDYSEAIIGLYKFFNPNEYTTKQQSAIQFSW